MIEINNVSLRSMSHSEVVQVLKDCTRGHEAAITIQRGVLASPSKNKFKKNKEDSNLKPKSGFLFRSKTPTAELFATQEKEIVPMRPKTPVVDTRNMSQKAPWATASDNVNNAPVSQPFSRNDLTRASLGVGGPRQDLSVGRQDTGHDRSADHLSSQFNQVNLSSDSRTGRSRTPGREVFS